jgi:transcriptional regulator
MLIHPWDAALGAEEWQTWLATTDRFGMLAVNHIDPAQAPLLLPTHFSLAGSEILLHLARPNDVWPHLEAAGEVRLAVIGDYAYIPTYWRAKAGGPDEDGVPTSYYTAVQFVCTPTVVDDPAEKADILRTQLADFQPEGRHAPMAADSPPYGACCPASAASGSRSSGWRPSSSTTTTTPSSTGNASSATSSSATGAWIPGPPSSSDGASPPSVSGAPAARSPEHHHLMRPKVLVGGLPGSAGAYRAVDPVGS